MEDQTKSENMASMEAVGDAAFYPQAREHISLLPCLEEDQSFMNYNDAEVLKISKERMFQNDLGKAQISIFLPSMIMYSILRNSLVRF